jgi:hypothetical protein
VSAGSVGYPTEMNRWLTFERWTRTLRPRLGETREVWSRPSEAVLRRCDAVAEVPRPEDTDQPEPAFGDVPVADIFVLLVENHRLAVRDAVHHLTLGVLAAGYPADVEAVSASDAMDILDAIPERGVARRPDG